MSYAKVDWDNRTRGGRRWLPQDHRPRRAQARVAIYLSGQLLHRGLFTSANKLAKGFSSATANVDNQFTAVHGIHGSQDIAAPSVRTLVPGNYEDLDQANLLVLVGSNTRPGAIRFCFQRHDPQPPRPRRQNRGDRSAPHREPADEADLFFWPFAPGTDTALSPPALLVYLADGRRASTKAPSTRTPHGFSDALARPPREIAPDVATTAAAHRPSTKVDVRALFFSSCFARRKRSSPCFSQGVKPVGPRAPTRSTPSSIAILATGRIGPPRHWGPFSLTGQPQCDGRGARSAGLANTLAGATWALRRTKSTGCSGFWHAAEHRRARRPQGRSDVRGHRGAARSRRCG